MSIPSFTASAPSFAAHFHTPLPRALRDDAASMSHDAFLARYASSTGPVRLGHWQCTDVDRPASRLGPQARNYQATMAVGDRIGTSNAAASGPVSALTAMLYERGVFLEIEAFHQLPALGGTATFIRGADGIGAEWAMGWSADVTQSALRAVIACANLLSALKSARV